MAIVHQLNKSGKTGPTSRIPSNLENLRFRGSRLAVKKEETTLSKENTGVPQFKRTPIMTRISEKDKTIITVLLMEVMSNSIPSIGSFLVPLWGDLIPKNVITSNVRGIDLPNEAE